MTCTEQGSESSQASQALLKNRRQPHPSQPKPQATPNASTRQGKDKKPTSPTTKAKASSTKPPQLSQGNQGDQEPEGEGRQKRGPAATRRLTRPIVNIPAIPFTNRPSQVSHHPSPHSYFFPIRTPPYERSHAQRARTTTISSTQSITEQGREGTERERGVAYLSDHINTTAGLTTRTRWPRTPRRARGLEPHRS